MSAVPPAAMSSPSGAVIAEAEVFARAWGETHTALCATNYKAGALSLLSFLERRGKIAHEIAPEDWRGFYEEALARGPRGTGERSAISIKAMLRGARAYLRLAHEQGRLAPHQVPARVAPGRPETLAVSSEVAAFRAHVKSQGRHKVMVGGAALGTRELLLFMERGGKALADLSSEDVRVFERELKARVAASSRVSLIMAGARAYLRWKAAQGAVDERRLASVIHHHVRTTNEDARSREVAAFGEKLKAAGYRSEPHIAQCRRAAFQLLLFLESQGKTLGGFGPAEWAGFREEMRRTRPSRAQDLCEAAIVYLRMSAREGRILAHQVPPSVYPHPTEALPDDMRRELSAFAAALKSQGRNKDTVSSYSVGACELLLYLHGQGKTLSEIGAADFAGFVAHLSARVDRGELKRSTADLRLNGVRCFLRLKARELADEGVLALALTSVRQEIAVRPIRDDRQRPAIMREVDRFREYRRSIGYEATESGHVLAFLLFLDRAGKTLADFAVSDWPAFCETASVPSRRMALAYLRMQGRAGIIRPDQVPEPPPRPRARTTEPVLPPGLTVCPRHLEEAMAACDLSPNTREGYRRYLRDCLVWLIGEGITDLSDVTRDVMTSYRLHIASTLSKKGTPYAGQTQLGILTGLRFFFGWLAKTGHLLADPTVHLPSPRLPQKLPRALKAADLSRLIRGLPATTLGLRDRALFELLYGTGLRRAEAAALQLGDVDLHERTVLVRQGKGRKDRIVPLGKTAREAILNYLDLSRGKLLRGDDPGALFIALGGREMKAGSLGDRIEELGRRVGLRVRPHWLRHSCATHLLKGRADIRHIQRLLGHKSLATTERYTRVEMSDLKAVIARCHPRERKA